jgi:hypothetical protein
MCSPTVGVNSQHLKWLIGERNSLPLKNGRFKPFSSLGTVPAISLAWPTDRPAAGSGRHKMTFNLTSLQHIAVSAIGAIFAATLFISAAVGPAAQII